MTLSIRHITICESKINEIIMTNLELKQTRLSMNLTQKQLAQLLHVHVMTISKWERGAVNIPADKAELLNYKKGK